MPNLFDMKGGKLLAILSAIGERMPPEIGERILHDPALLDVMLKAADQHINKNPYEMRVEHQLAELRRADKEESEINPHWEPIPEEVYVRLAATAPPWPKGKHAYRSLRIRFGEGSDGVAQTFEAHCSRIRRVFGQNGFWRWEHLHSGKVPYKGELVERLRLLNGDRTHKAVIEWVIVDLGSHRKRDSVTAVRGVKSLADELLVVVWMFPDMIRVIDYDKLPGLFAAGYESNVPGYSVEAWQCVVVVGFCRGYRRVYVDASGRNDDRSDYSVPVLRK